MKHLLITCFCTLLLLSGCSNQKELNKYDKTDFDCGFNTFCTLTAFLEDEQQFNEMYEVMVSDFRHYHELFDIYHNYEGINNLKTINDFAGKEPVKVEKPIINLLKLAKEVDIVSEGQFDITGGALLKVWHNYRENGKAMNINGQLAPMPSQAELDAVKNIKGYEHLIIDEAKQTVYIDQEGISLDVGGIGKGYATELVAQHLQELGLKYGSVNGGGNQRLISTKADGKGWNVGIQTPRPSEKINDGISAVIKDVSDASVVTSGDYQNFYYNEEGKALAHIIDFDTLYPADYYHSVTILVPNSGLADCLSTTIFAMDYEESQIFINKINQEYNLDVGVVYITSKPINEKSIKANTENEYYITYTDNLASRIVVQ